ncbi:hypothetical protein [Streptomyces longwoodensis]|uniref:hypothetical protein n=1 Tax=Streptomyces longwoodensis TaxID=68231 RepID=UPI0036FECB53
MLKAYLRRHDNTTQPVTVDHQGQHLGVHDGKVRFARLYWERAEPRDAEEAAGYRVLEEAVPLLDTLIVTRVSPVNGERAVFHGVLTEASTDGEGLSLTAVDNPQQERLYDQTWWRDAPLYPSDQAEPEAGPQPYAQAPGVQTLGGAPLPQAGQPVPVGQGAALRLHNPNGSHPQSTDPAARPGGHPAAHPAGFPQEWQRAPQAAAQA